MPKKHYLSTCIHLVPNKKRHHHSGIFAGCGLWSGAFIPHISCNSMTGRRWKWINPPKFQCDPSVGWPEGEQLLGWLLVIISVPIWNSKGNRGLWVKPLFFCESSSRVFGLWYVWVGFSYLFRVAKHHWFIGAPNLFPLEQVGWFLEPIEFDGSFMYFRPQNFPKKSFDRTWLLEPTESGDIDEWLERFCSAIPWAPATVGFYGGSGLGVGTFQESSFLPITALYAWRHVTLF